MEITKKEVEKLIENRKSDTFQNHLWLIITRDFTPTGEINEHPNEIKVWNQNIWNAVFYPIFKFKFNTNNHLIDISDHLNPIGKSIIYMFFIGFIYITSPRSLSDFNFNSSWIMIIVIITFLLLIIVIVRAIYKHEKQNQLDQIFEILEIEKEEKMSENEWSLKKVFERILMYPLCIGIIILSILFLIPNDKIFSAMTLIGLAGTYLFTDIKILINKKNRDNTGNR